MLAAKASSWSDSPARASAIAVSTASASRTVPLATAVAVEEQLATRDVTAIPSLSAVMTSRADVVEQGDAGLDEDLGPEVGVAPGDRRARR